MFGNMLMGAAGASLAGGGGYSIGNSMVLDDGSSQNLKRTPSSAASKRIGTFSMWVKRGVLGTNQMLFTNERDDSAGTQGVLEFQTDDQLRWKTESTIGANIMVRETTQVFRDPHAWYHIMVTWNSNKTDDTCASVWVNGEQVTDFVTKTNFSSAQDLGWPSTTKPMTVGAAYNGANYSDVYLSEFVYLDGTASSNATDFGEYDINGVWQPIELDTATLFPNPTITDNSVNFDGTNDYLTRGGALTGLSDGDAGSTSFWFKFNGGNGSDVSIFTDNAGHVHIRRGSDNKIRMLMHTSGASELVDIQTSDTYTADGTWHHCMASWNTTSDTQHLYIDGVDKLSVNNSATGTIDYTQTDYAVGARTSGTNKINSDLAEFYFTNEYLDLSQASNRLKFLTATGAPASLGSDGSTPTGTAAVVYLSGATSTWHTNDGTGGGFTENGALTDGSTIQGVYGRNSFYLDASASDHLGRDAVTKDNADATVTYIGSNNDTSNATTYTFSSEPIGTAAANRKVVVITTTSGSPTQGFSSVTINGSSMTKLLQVNNTDNEVSLGIFELEYSSGTTADIVVTASRSTNRMGIDVYNINGAGSYFDSVTASFAAGGTNPSVLTHAVPEGGVSIAAIATENASSTYTWTNLTEDNDEGVELALTRSTASGAQSSFQSALAVTVSRTSPGTSKGAAFAISWGKGNDLKDINSPTQTTDTCTDNHATWSLLLSNAGKVTLSEGNMRAATSTSAGNVGLIVSGFELPTSGKYYWEWVTNTVGVTPALGWRTIENLNPNGHSLTGNNQAEFITGNDYNIGDGRILSSTINGSTSLSQAPYGNFLTVSGGNPLQNGDVLGCAYDADNGLAWFSYNNTWVDGDGTDSSATVKSEIEAGTSGSQAFTTANGAVGNAGLCIISACKSVSSGNFTLRTRSEQWTGTCPTGFTAVSTKNQAAAITYDIEDGTAHFQATAYTGNGSSIEVNQSGNSTFQTDFAWIKNRVNAGGYRHELFDAVRGVQKYLQSSSADAEGTDSTTLTSFDSDGYSYGSGIWGNSSGEATIAWQWKGNGTSGSSNTDGSITSTVNANDAAGFSVVKYTSTNGGGAGTVGHGQTGALDLILVKNLDSTDNWAVYHSSNTSSPETDYLILNLTNATADSNTFWNDTAPTSTVFSVGTSGAVNDQGAATNHIAYCFRSIPGYSAFGSYEANASLNGPLILTDFKPAFFMCKSIDAVGDWLIFDAAREPYNEMQATLSANTSGAENTSTTVSDIDFLSNGVKLREDNIDLNNTGTYIYAAFAEYPFAGSSPATAR